MGTLKVRPVLIETKERTNIWWSGHKMYYNRTPEEPRTPCYELILISLEDENIEVGCECVNLAHKIIVQPTDSEWANSNSDNLKKVIARQSQIPPEYISKFIEQYNNGCVEDLEIEMEYISGWSKLLVEKQGSPIKYHIQPKLTKGFVTIVEKEPVLYTKEEVILYLQKYRVDLSSGKTPIIGDTTKDWFENNKKK